VPRAQSGIARQRLEPATFPYLLVLNAQQTYQQALISLVQAKANRFATRRRSYQALGAVGGTATTSRRSRPPGHH